MTIKKQKNNSLLWLAIIFIAPFFILGVSSFSYLSNKKNLSNFNNSPEIVIPNQEKQKSTVVFLHGMGSSANDWKNIFQKYNSNKIFPNTKFIFPQAPIIPIDIHMGKLMSSWYNITGDARDVLKLEINKSHLINSVNKIKNIIQKEINSGTQKKNIFLVGHSQGGSLALASSLNLNYSLGGVFILAGFLPEKGKELELSTIESKNTPYHFYHSLNDEIIPLHIAKFSFDLMKTKGYKGKFTELSGGHFFISELRFLIKEIKKLTN